AVAARVAVQPDPQFAAIRRTRRARHDQRRRPIPAGGRRRSGHSGGAAAGGLQPLCTRHAACRRQPRAGPVPGAAHLRAPGLAGLAAIGAGAGQRVPRRPWHHGSLL
ncbi:LOW QUALITY PROTEIN: hypothetical protein HMPREF0005_05856, partial [Achromobacter xylosoxidans C54]